MDVSSSIRVMMATESHVSHHLPLSKMDRMFFRRSIQKNNTTSPILRMMRAITFIGRKNNRVNSQRVVHLLFFYSSIFLCRRIVFYHEAMFRELLRKSQERKHHNTDRHSVYPV